MTARTRLTEPTDPGIRRFLRMECHVGSAEKFYTVIVEANPDAPAAFRCRAEWGRIGGAISTQDKATGDATTCERALDELAREKQAKGYRAVMDERPAGDFPAHATTPAAEPRTERSGPSRETLQDLLDRRRREARWAL